MSDKEMLRTALKAIISELEDRAASSFEAKNSPRFQWQILKRIADFKRDLNQL